MALTSSNWKNKGGTAGRSCSCGTWKQHWINYSGHQWPKTCSVYDCGAEPTLGAHIFNAKETGEYIVPACDACNKRTEPFDLKDGISCVSANKKVTCEP